MQAGFARYGEERILLPPPRRAAPRTDRRDCRLPSWASGRRRRSTRSQLSRLYRAATPAPVARLEDYRLPDWERQGSQCARAALVADADPAFRGRRGVRPGIASRPQRAARRPFCQIGVAKEEQPHYLRVITRPEHDPTDLIALRPRRRSASAAGRCAAPRRDAAATSAASSPPCGPTRRRSTGDSRSRASSTWPRSRC